MCGIVFSWERSKPISKKKLNSALLSINHRGPDAQASWISPCGHYSLGHTRLSIIDVHGGHQPLISNDEQVVAVVNGEFYDHEKIRRGLVSEGYKFKTESDSELLIALYEKYQQRCLDYLKGEFSFVLFDRRSDTVFAARDRFGIKPLYFYHDSQKVIMASECKAILEMGVEAEWNKETAIKNDHLFMVSQSDSAFEGIYQVKPGCSLVLKSGHLVESSYWDLEFPPEPIQRKGNTESDYIGEFKNKLIDAIETRLHSDVPVGVYLSGGLDSCSILGVASHLSSTPITAFSIGFEDSAYDESTVAKEMADHVGANLDLTIINDQLLADNFEETVWHCEAPMFNSHSVAKYLLSKKVNASGYKVVLTGEGSDDILGGYAFLRKDIIQSRTDLTPEQKNEKLKQLVESNKIYGSLFSNTDNPEMQFLKNMLGYVPCYMESGKNYFDKISDLYTEDFKEYSRNQNVFDSLLGEFDYGRKIKGRSPVNQSLYMWCKSHLPCYILSLVGDRVEMGNSVEGRLPFLDHDLVEFAAKLPLDMKMRGMTEKYILREAMKEFITNTVYQRQKQPFLAPPINLDPDSPIGQLVHDTFLGSDLERLPFFDREKILTLLENAKTSDEEARKHFDKIILQILSMCFMQKKFFSHEIETVKYAVGA